MNSRTFVRALAIPLLGLLLAAPALAATGETDPAPAKKTVNLNQASGAELTRLPRVGEKLADRIVAYRTQHGPFKRIEDLMEVKGVGEKLFHSLKPYLAVSGPTTLTEKVSSAGTRGKAASKSASPKRTRAGHARAAAKDAKG